MKRLTQVKSLISAITAIESSHQNAAVKIMKGFTLMKSHSIVHFVQRGTPVKLPSVCIRVPYMGVNIHKSNSFVEILVDT